MIPPVSNLQLVFEHHFPKLNADRDEQGRYTHRTTRQVFRGFRTAHEALEEQVTSMKLSLNAKQGLVDKLEGDLKHIKEAARNARR